MDLITVLGAVSQFHAKLDELIATATANRAILDRLQRVLDVVVDQMEDFSNKYRSLEAVGACQARLNQMVIDAGGAVSSPPSAGPAQTSQPGSNASPSSE